jgi:lysophospholipase L1-like esterase
MLPRFRSARSHSTSHPLRWNVGVLAVTAALALPLAPALAATAPAALAVPAAPAGSAEPWTGSWATSPQRMTGTAFTDRTLRMIVHPTLGGSSLRIRLANIFGASDVTFDSVGIARATASGAADLVAGTSRRVTFHGRASITVPTGADVISDPVALGVRYGQDLAVDVHVTAGGDAAAITGHDGANGTQFVATGSHVGDVAAAFTGTVNSWFWLDGVDVRPARGVGGGVVALGDSITDGAYTTWNGNNRWTDDLAARFQALPPAGQHAVLNEGIGGNQVLTDRTDCCGSGTSISALSRERNDVLRQTGARYLIVADGINDIGYNATADALIAGLTTLAQRAHTAGMRVIGATITPYGCASGCFGPAQEATRQEVNAWIRTTHVFDGVVDFDLAVRDPADPSQVLPAYQADHLHPNVTGLAVMAGSIDLRLFR